jgi:hypothetical protein
MPDWSRPCRTTVRVGENLGAGGATTFVFDRGEVYGWRMTIQGSRQRLLDSVLPHEITHMVFASHFRRPLPRWADEGGATSVEHDSERQKHRKMLGRFLRTGRGIAFNRMFAMKEYPPDIMPLYAQGFSLAEYLIQRGGRRKYVEFLDTGLSKNDWSAAIREHYGMAGAGPLQNTWLAWVRQGSPPLAPRQDPPSAGKASIVLASADRRPRPEPNLIWRIPKRQRAASPAASVGSSAPSNVSASQNVEPSPPSDLLAAGSPSGATALPDSGWRAVGAPRNPPPTQAAPAPSPIHSQLARPQPYERSRQIILEWSRQ